MYPPILVIEILLQVFVICINVVIYRLVTSGCVTTNPCMHMYGSEIWILNCNYVDELRVAWRKIKRRIWRLHNRAHNAIVQNLSYNIDDQMEIRMLNLSICV